MNTLVTVARAEELLVELTVADVINRPDEYGNTPLHLAAWNGSKKIFSWMMKNGADLRAVNHDGLSPLALTARFGLWDMFGFIRKNYLERNLRKYGYVECREFDFSHMDTSRNIHDLAKTKRTLKGLSSILCLLDQLCPDVLGPSEFEKDPDALERDDSSSFNSWYVNRETLIAAALEIKQARKLEELRDIAEKNSQFSEEERESRKEKSRFISALEVIRLYKPTGWYEAVKDCIDELALKKWRKCYCFVYIGQACVPTFVTFVIFGLMWQTRSIVVKENSGIPGWFVAPLPEDAFEAQCGWAAIQNSLSGRLQAVLALYGVLAMLGIAAGQQRIGFHDLDPKRNSKIEVTNVTDYFLLNLKSMLCTIVSAMFISIGAARVMAGQECKTFYLHIEKNATAIAGLFLSVNLLNTLRPIKAFGAFFTTIYHMIVTDLFRFSVVYLSFFLAFLIAIQTVYAANNHLMDGIAQGSLINISDFDARRKVSPTNVPGAPFLDDPAACSAKVMRTSDTAFKLLTMSLGDGFTDILQESRSLPDPACGGFQADYLLIVLYFAWIVLTNILAMNLLIAMISQTFDSKFGHNSEDWHLDIVARVIRYEHNFPELLRVSHRPTRNSLSISGISEDVSLTIMCVPEVYWIACLARYLWTHFGETKNKDTVCRLASYFSLRMASSLEHDEFSFLCSVHTDLLIWALSSRT
jgi:hypothetical protein